MLVLLHVFSISSFSSKVEIWASDVIDVKHWKLFCWSIAASTMGSSSRVIIWATGRWAGSVGWKWERTEQGWCCKGGPDRREKKRGVMKMRTGKLWDEKKKNKKTNRDEDSDKIKGRWAARKFINGDRRALLSTTVGPSRRTLHRKVSTQQVCHERRQMVEVPSPAASWFHHRACLPTAAPQSFTSLHHI